MVGQLYLLLYLFTKLTCHVIILLTFGTLVANFHASYWSRNERFRCKFKLSYLLRLEWSSLISFLEDVSDQKSNFCWKKRPFIPCKIFLWKEGRSFQTWEDRNNRNNFRHSYSSAINSTWVKISNKLRLYKHNGTTHVVKTFIYELDVSYAPTCIFRSNGHLNYN